MKRFVQALDMESQYFLYIFIVDNGLRIERVKQGFFYGRGMQKLIMDNKFVNTKKVTE